MNLKSTKLVFDLIENIGIHDHKDILNISKKLPKRDFLLIYEQLKTIYESLDDDINLLRSSYDIFKTIPSGYMNYNSEFVCSSVECQSKALITSCKKLLLYSDVIGISDPLLPPLTSISLDGISSDSRIEFANALLLLYSIKPLADSGMLLLLPNNYFDLCNYCMEKAVSQSGISIDIAFDIFFDRNILSIGPKEDNEYSACISFKDSNIHDLVSDLDNIDVPNSVKRNILINKIGIGDYYTLSKNEAFRIDGFQSKILRICLQLNYANTLAENIEGSLITDSLSEWDIINSSRSIIRHADKNLNFYLPFLDEIKISDLIAIKESAPKSFENLRLSLSNMKMDFSKYSEISNLELGYYINNKLLPDIKIIGEDLKTIQRKTLVKSVSLAGIGSLFASIGFYDGAFSPSILSALQQIGLLGIALEGLHICSDYFKELDNIRGKAPYFLWKSIQQIKSHKKNCQLHQEL